MQRIISSLVGTLAVVASRAKAVNVGTCEQFAAVDRKTETEVTITNADFACDEYTRLSIRTDMVLKSSVGKVTFSNLALKVYGSLTVEPDVCSRALNWCGGALRLELGTQVVFKGTADFVENSIMSTTMGTYDYQDVEQIRKGGAIHNKGSLTFEKDATFTANRNDGDQSGSGPGGAIFVHVKGSIHFMGNLNMTNNFAENSDGGAKGGAIHNRGDIIVDGTADFTGNVGGRGGAIYQERWATIVFNDFANFASNGCFDFIGGAVANMGGDFTCNTGSLFVGNSADSSGDGGVGRGIYNEDGGIVTLEGPTTFQQNFALWGGGIYNQLLPGPFNSDTRFTYKTPVLAYPDDTIFQDNSAQFCSDIAYGRGEDCSM